MKDIYHLHLTPNDVGYYAFLAGDPGRIPLIAKSFESAREVSAHRGFVCHNGFLENVRVCAVASGIGCPSTAIVVEELAALGVRNFIRVGTCGSLQGAVASGDLVISTGAIRCDGTGAAYVPIEYPAVPDFAVLSALISAGTAAGARCHVGVTHCKDAFYSEIAENCADVSGTQAGWMTWQRANALATEMEASALFIVAGLRRCRAGAVFTVVGSVETGDLIADSAGIPSAIGVAIAAMRSLILSERGTES